MRQTITFILLLFFYSCQTSDNKNSTHKHKTSDSSSITNANQKIAPQEIKDSILPKIDSKKMGDYMSDTTDYVWYAKGSDSGNYWVKLVFQKEFLVYQFHGQCLYWFFTRHYHTNTDKIELLWSYKTDCKLDMDFLSKPNGIKKYPKLGDSFCEYKLVNDTTIVASYNFPEWTNKINQLVNDSIFPTFFYLSQDGYNQL